MNKVIIVESPNKTHTIQTYVGKGYDVLSSVGHICDLATSGKGGLGIDIENDFAPTYKINSDKEKIVAELKKKCNGKQVFIATDPDREGEAIAFHLARELNLDYNALNRVTFEEITQKGIDEGMANPRSIDMKMVDSQETRRMIDRILGFKLSKLLQRKIGSKSAGRVQSAVLLLIVNLEKDILAFIPEKYYEMEASSTVLKLKMTEYMGNKIDAKNKITDRTLLEDLQPRLLSFVVSDITSKLITKSSAPTFTTSTLQQQASIKLGFDSSKTMRVAQSLFEGKNIGSETVGLITYMRTDSTRLADSFVKEANQYIINNYGNRYLGAVKVKKQKGAQEAHEGIRPTDVLRTPDSIKQYLTLDEYKLYNLIYKRTLSSLMSNATFNSTRVEFENTDSKWVQNGQTLVFDGFLKVYGKDVDDENQNIKDFKIGEAYNATKIEILDKETEPKSRYTEASLIEDMEKFGIGRPATYASTIATLKERKYIKLEKKSIIPTDNGIETSDNLQEYFSSMINIKYTAQMEADLDLIRDGEVPKLTELNRFYNDFMPLLETASANMEYKYPIMTEEICPNCNGHLVIRLGKYGEFTSCENYPDCSYVKKDEEFVSVDTHIICPSCGKGTFTSRLSGKGKTKGNLFYACSNYPKCKKSFSDKPTNEVCPLCGAIMVEDSEGNKHCSDECLKKQQSILCPICQKGYIVKRVAGKGKNKDKEFYACNNYPKCTNSYDNEPINKYCNKCGSIMLRDNDGVEYCSKKCEEQVIIEPQIEIPNQNVETAKCPKCKTGNLVKRVAGKGKNTGNVFYGCDRFPKCKTLVSIDEFNELIKNKK